MADSKSKYNICRKAEYDVAWQLNQAISFFCNEISFARAEVKSMCLKCLNHFIHEENISCNNPNDGPTFPRPVQIEVFLFGQLRLNLRVTPA